MLVTLLVALGAFNSQNNLLFWAFGFAIASLMVSGVLSGSMLMGIGVRRGLAGEATAGEACELRYTVSRRGRFLPAFAIRISERVGRRRNGSGGGAGDGEGGEGGAGEDWRGFVEEEPSAYLARIGAGRSAHAGAVIVPRRRGRMRLETVRVESSFPFGLFGKSLTFRLPGSLIVRPGRVRVKRGVLRRIAARAEQGAAPVRAAGQGEEFYALRLYEAGDALRSIAWKATARSDQLLVRQHAAPAPARVWVVLRLVGGEDGGVGETAVSLAATLLRESVARGMEAGLAVAHTGAQFRPGAAPGHLGRMLDHLALLGLPGSGDGAAPVFPGAAAEPRAACVVVHGSSLDRSFGPARAIHLSAAHPGAWSGGRDRGSVGEGDGGDASGAQREAAGVAS